MHNFKYAIFVLLGGCCYGILSTFVKLAYAAGFSVEAVTIGQYFFGTIISGITFLFNTKQVPTLLQSLKLMALGIPFGLTGIFYYQSLKSASVRNITSPRSLRFFLSPPKNFLDALFSELAIALLIISLISSSLILSLTL